MQHAWWTVLLTAGLMTTSISCSTNKGAASSSTLPPLKDVQKQASKFGSVLEVPTLDGNKKIKIPPGTPSHTKLRLKGHGMPRMGKAGKGDAFVRVIVKIPKGLSGAQSKLFDDLAREGF